MQQMELISSVNETASGQMMLYNPSSVQLLDELCTHNKGYANPSLFCSSPKVKQPRYRLEQVKPISSVKENVSSKQMMMDNPPSKGSNSLSFFTIPFQPISGQCSFQHLCWNNLRWVDELDTKGADDDWEHFEPSQLALMDKSSTEVIEMDVICTTADL